MALDRLEAMRAFCRIVEVGSFSGAAGLSLALTLPSHMRIAVLSKGDLA